MASPSPLTALVPFLPRPHFTTLQVRSPAGGHFSPHFLSPSFQAQDGEQHPARDAIRMLFYTLKILWGSISVLPKETRLREVLTISGTLPWSSCGGEGFAPSLNRDSSQHCSPELKFSLGKTF